MRKISDFIDKIKSKRDNKKPSYEIFKIRKNIQKNAADTLLMKDAQMKDAISNFLESNEHSSKYDSFIEYLEQNNPVLLASMPREEIKTLYNKRYEAYLEHHDKNEFGLDAKYVDDQLRKMFHRG
jgi:shikimate kinase